MTFKQSINTCFFKKYATFSGRASRSEYWYFLIFTYAIFLLIHEATNLYSVDYDMSLPLLMWTFCTVIPITTVSVRRLHDVNRSGWWILLSFTVVGNLLLLYWFVLDSKDDNKYGSPKS